MTRTLALFTGLGFLALASFASATEMRDDYSMMFLNADASLDEAVLLVCLNGKDQALLKVTDGVLAVDATDPALDVFAAQFSEEKMRQEQIVPPSLPIEISNCAEALAYLKDRLKV